ncbi:MAG TPA: hypothetical protein VF978_03620 [Gemmatimonadales bacterium]
MTRPSFAHFAALLAPALVFTAVFAHREGPAGDAERNRLRAHFAEVAAELVARDVSDLLPAQRAARARHIERLQAYARAGVFPHNTDFPGQRVPYFIDRVGTRCAMAYLIEQSGHGDYVHRVAVKTNNAFIANIARDPELAAPLIRWLDENGLTVEEAARIQPAYDGRPCCTVVVPDDPPRVSPQYALGTSAVAMIGGTSIYLNASRPQPKWIGALGVATGAFGVTMGFFHLDDPGANRTLGVVNLGVGAAATYFGVRGLTGRERRAPAEPPVAALVPWVSPQGTGVVVNLRF